MSDECEWCRYRPGSHTSDCPTKEIDRLRAEVERLHKETLIAWNNWGKELEQTKLQVGELQKTLETIAKYDAGTGCCPYGCDTPTIAKNALKGVAEKPKGEIKFTVTPDYKGDHLAQKRNPEPQKITHCRVGHCDGTDECRCSCAYCLAIKYF